MTASFSNGFFVSREPLSRLSIHWAVAVPRTYEVLLVATPNHDATDRMLACQVEAAPQIERPRIASCTESQVHAMSCKRPSSRPDYFAIRFRGQIW